jgi:hypothetical protein
MPADWEFEHTVEIGASREAAWKFWTKVDNWSIDPSIEWVKLDGPFEAGAVGETKQHGLPPLRWRIAELRPVERAVIEIEMTEALVRFALEFEAVSRNRSRLRQRMTLEGPGAEKLSAGLGTQFEQGIRDGMERLADAIMQEV